MTRTVRIREVWASNLQEEMHRISMLIDDYNYIALDTEFPGVVIRPIGLPSLPYQAIRANVDMLSIIQLGISLSNADGISPDDCTTWQFNFVFDLSKDMYANDAIDLLKSAGIDFNAHLRDGIDPLMFGYFFTISGLMLNPNLKWISFHGAYDFAYLFKLLTDSPLPKSERAFSDKLNRLFPIIYDLKVLMMDSKRFFGGLNKLAETFGCERFGQTHQAGSDSLLTLDVFFRMREDIFKGTIDSIHINQIFGLSLSPEKSPAVSPQKQILREGNGPIIDKVQPIQLKSA